MINLYLSLEQKNRERQEWERVNQQTNLDTDLYSVGWFDGLMNSEPTQLEEQSYWSGYSLGQREYWAKKLGVEIPTEF
ncbi:conserved hypothetical protein [Hyella patelloides LEGE 07179]|uniref:Uncharacterized protein n=1 Tax=Hyella patelloides LEGE 07179 TaxID=945734 RepID=A0A563VRY0_9CYAN|nr:hypothetical protein [Hyella patelloides]VEP14142.1 conserved hypothetical protein [Hyella patelloides LEGE 07179]